MKIKKKLIFLIALLILAPLVYSVNYGEELYGANYYGLDLIPPDVSFVSPTNQVYATNTILVNVTNSSYAISVWWNNGSANLTYTSSVTLTLPNGAYTFIVYANDSFGNLNSTNVSFSVAVPAQAEEGTTTGSSYSSQTYFTGNNFLAGGNNFNLRANEKIKFVVNFTNHTLTLNSFNFTTAKIKIESGIIVAYLEKGILKYFDLDNDSVNDLKIRYDGVNNTQAIIFMQEIKYEKEKINSSVKVEEVIADADKKEFNWNLSWLILLIVLILSISLLLLFFLYKKHRKKRHNMFGY